VHLLSQASAVNMRCRAVLDWTEWLPAAQYIPNSHAPREGGGGGVGGGGVWSELSQMGWGGGVYFLSFSLQVTYTNNITLLVLKYLLIYSKLCYDEFHIYSPNFAKKIFKYSHAKQRKCC
jgi:hypothetical protein